MFAAQNSKKVRKISFAEVVVNFVISNKQAI